MLPRSFALRAALAAAAAVLALSLLGSGWGWLRAEAALGQQLDLLLAAEAGGLVRDYDDLGAAGLVAAVQAYARRTGPLRVLLQTADGRPVAGRLLTAPGTQAAGSAVPLTVPLAPAGLRGYATLEAGGAAWRVLGAPLPGGLTLVVGADLRVVRDAARALAWSPPLAALGAAAAALGLGFLAARRLEGRLARVGDAARAVMAGDLARRLPEAGGGDEFDRLVAAVNQVLARVEALVAAQRQVTDDIAHDLRSPLNRLRLMLEGAAAGPRDPQGDAQVLAQAVAELDQVLATFTALLRIAGAEAGARRGAQDVDLSRLAEGLAEAYAPVLEEAGRPFTATIVPGMHLRGDADLLRQAVANLLDNALLHGAGATRLALRAGPVIVVEDEGPGVPEGERERVLRRFVRLDRSRNTPGTGLGLALVSAAAAAHGGRLRLEAARPDGAGLRAVLDLACPPGAA